jgi:hypothetical protein
MLVLGFRVDKFTSMEDAMQGDMRVVGAVIEGPDRGHQNQPSWYQR